ncbi:MAG TPA: hypothetical protein VFD23_00290 [Clostridia bacterium]|nr:hypothetical protein [Clostridia bacterium]
MKIEQMMKRYGRAMHLSLAHGEASETFFGFIQPLRYKNKMYLFGVNTPIGYDSQGYYLYIGPPEHDLTGMPRDARLHAGGVDYQIDRAEKVYQNGKVFYVWAVVRTIVRTN